MDGSMFRPLGALALIVLVGCDDAGAPPADIARPSPAAEGADAGGAPANVPVPIDPRVVDYGEALRTASLKLVGDLPKLADIQALARAKDPGAFYASQIDAMLLDPRFARTQIAWWKSTFKTGNSGSAQDGAPDFDAAAVFAASVVVGHRPYTDLFTATRGTCQTFESGRFVSHDCPGGPAVGVLTDPGLMAQFYGNLAFRRVRFVQETFACSTFPAEFAAQPTVVDNGVYTSPWPFDSISGHRTSQNPSIDFQSTTGRVCANCHSTLNHVAPLFAYFDKNGQRTSAIAVMKPGMGAVTRDDWLPPGQPFAWRNGVIVDDLTALGATIAADPDVLRCAVKRVYDFAWSRGDIVDDQASVSDDDVASLADDFAQNGYDLAKIIRAVFTSDDFVRF